MRLCVVEGRRTLGGGAGDRASGNRCPLSPTLQKKPRDLPVEGRVCRQMVEPFSASVRAD